MFQIIIFVSIICFINSTPIQKSIDWRQKGAVLPVPDAKGSCIHASVINALDSLSSINHIELNRPLVQLSAQQIYDCSGKWCPCGYAGNVTQAFDLIYYENLGLAVNSNASYPYTGQCTHTCHFNKSGETADYGGNYNSDGDQDEEGLYRFLEHGPLAAEINANQQFYHYTGGILDDPTCTADNFNHFVLIVGYGTENGVNYWIARNSWGTNWGEKGYIRIVRDKNMCGIGSRWAQPAP